MRKTIMAAAVALSLAGCATSGIEMVADPNAEINQKHLIIHNQSLANKITIVSVRSRSVGGQLEANLTVKNLSSRDANIMYRFSWFDGDQFEVEEGTESWTPAVMHGAAEINVKGLAPNGSVKSFKLNVREQ